MSQFSVEVLLSTKALTIRDVICSGECRHKSDEEHTVAAHLVFPYRGVYVRHLDHDDAVAEANQVLFFNSAETYRVSHPVEGGDASLDLAISEPVLCELAPREQVRSDGAVAFRRQRLRIDPRAQALVALLRHGLSRKIAETLEAETLALTLVRRALGERTSHAAPSWCCPRISPGAGPCPRSRRRSASPPSISRRCFSKLRRCRSIATSCA